MSREELFQDFVAPICSFDNIDGSARLAQFFGSAFFIDEEGTFLTARHVAEASSQCVDKPCGLVIKDPEDSSSLVSPLGYIEKAPAPWDVAVGKIGAHSKCMFNWPSIGEFGPWHDVATFGYPDSAVMKTGERFDVHMRALKGYIVRELEGHEFGFAVNGAPSYELSFVVPKGISGSPLFVTGAKGQAELIGVCTASVETETYDHVWEEADENGIIIREKKVRIEQFGVANNLIHLSDWRPNLFNGKSLREILTR